MWYGGRWLCVGSSQEGWALEWAASSHSRSLTLLHSLGLLLHVGATVIYYSLHHATPIHSSGTLKFSKYCRLLWLMKEDCLTFISATGRRAEEWLLSLGVNNDPLRSSISIIIMIAISILINCVHFALTVVYMHEDRVRTNGRQDWSTAQGLVKPQREDLFDHG